MELHAQFTACHFRLKILALRFPSTIHYNINVKPNANFIIQIGAKFKLTLNVFIG